MKTFQKALELYRLKPKYKVGQKLFYINSNAFGEKEIAECEILGIQISISTEKNNPSMTYHIRSPLLFDSCFDEKRVKATFSKTKNAALKEIREAVKKSLAEKIAAAKKTKERAEKKLEKLTTIQA